MWNVLLLLILPEGGKPPGPNGCDGVTEACPFIFCGVGGVEELRDCEAEVSGREGRAALRRWSVK